MANRRFIQFFKTLHNEPVFLDCNFAVDVANVNGAGVTSLKGPGIQSVFLHSTAAFTGTSHTSILIDGIASTANLAVGMPVQGGGVPVGAKIAQIVSGTSINLTVATTTSATASITYQAVGSPNPAAGEIVVKLQDNYNRLFTGYSSIIGPLGAATTSSKANVINVISTLGPATLAQWQAVGLPVGVTPAVGVTFVGSQAAVIGGSAQTAIMLAAGSGITNIEFAGNSNLSIAPLGASSGLDGAGSTFYLRCMKNGVLTAPTDGTNLSLSFYLSNTRIMSAGE